MRLPHQAAKYGLRESTRSSKVQATFVTTCLSIQLLSFFWERWSVSSPIRYRRKLLTSLLRLSGWLTMHDDHCSRESLVRRSNWGVRTMCVCNRGFNYIHNTDVCPPHPTVFSDHYSYNNWSCVLRNLYDWINQSWASNWNNARRRYVRFRDQHIPCGCGIVSAIHNRVVQQRLWILSRSWTSTIHCSNGSIGTVLEESVRCRSLLSSLDLRRVVAPSRSGGTSGGGACA